jgi:hypothetical protein
VRFQRVVAKPKKECVETLIDFFHKFVIKIEKEEEENKFIDNSFNNINNFHNRIIFFCMGCKF